VGSEIVQQFARGDWVKPLGLSYLVFRLINVLVDARRGAWERPPSWSEFCHFLFTPALFVAGPLERWGHWEKPVGADRGTQVATGVQQGFLEGSNVDSLQELVQMITVERSFTATQKALSGIGRLQENLITNILR
jgi:hypothetical protein